MRVAVSVRGGGVLAERTPQSRDQEWGEGVLTPIPSADDDFICSPHTCAEFFMDSEQDKAPEELTVPSCEIRNVV